MTRKRRLTAPVGPRDRIASQSAFGEGSSRATARDLGIGPGGSFSRADERNDDIAVPLWQPDSNVSHCPICNIQFSFWHRKHHCRKCGRVVCAKCSPHRITIPRQYIVRAPEEARLLNASLVDMTDDDEAPPWLYDLRVNPALEGGEEVRVCNPCVPDPNLSPPLRHTTAQFPEFETGSSRAPFVQQRYLPSQHSGMPRYMTYDASHAAPYQAGRHQYLNRRPSSSGDSQSPANQGRASVSGIINLSPPSRSSRRSSGVNITSSVHQSSMSSASSRTSHHLRPNERSITSPSASPQPSRYELVDQAATSPSGPPSRRNIPEEDECPVCHEELPPKGSHDSTAAREQHVKDCIAANFAGPSTQSHTPTPAAAASAPRPDDPSGVRTPALVEGSRRRRYTQGMLRYKATEKDCIDETGNPQECIVCFEDFHEGDEMGRLECFCKFHAVCIRQWWDTKGDGSCPTHQGGFVLGGT